MGRSWAAKPKTGEPVAIQLEDLGLPTQDSQLLRAGATVYTASFVDQQHAMVTFAVKRLLKRLPNGKPEDEDRTIRALLLELPSGRVVGETEWRVNDLGRYLFPLGRGNFLLRQRDRLTVIAPAAGLAHGAPFAEHPLLHTEQVIEGLLLSPDRSILTLETGAPEDAEVVAATGGGVVETDEPRIQISFYRLHWTPEGIVDHVSTAGRVKSHNVVNLPLTATGYLTMKTESSTRWLFDFHPYTGKVMELSPFDSSCRPSPTFVSPSVFVAFGCFGGEDKPVIGGFDMTGAQMWQQSLGSSDSAPSFAIAPDAGRFALARILTSVPPAGLSQPQETTTTEQVRVFQAESGRVLLTKNASPFQKTGQNYDLSPDGQILAVVQQGYLMLYPLPQASAREQKDQAAADKLVPAAYTGQIELTAITSSSNRTAALGVHHEPVAPGVVAIPPATNTAIVEGNEVIPLDEQDTPAAGAATASASAQSGARTGVHTPVTVSGDVPRRKPPTLYGPDEKHPPTKQAEETPGVTGPSL